MAATADGWVLKKPTSQSGKPWASSALQKRYVQTRGPHVSYYADAPAGAHREAGAKPRGVFDLREVSAAQRSSALSLL